MSQFIADDLFDGQLERSLTAAARGCADLGEVLAVAGRIKPGDLASWAEEWTATADAVLADADRGSEADDPVSARRAYLRASEYYRQAFFFARADLDDPILRSAYAAHVNTFRAALPLLPWSSTELEIEHDGVVARGYLLRPDDSGARRPTIIAPAGYDSTAESGYSFSAVSALERGMNCLVFEGPGQGGVLYTRRLPLRPDYETVVTPVVDWLIGQDGVNPDALVLLGRSFAGYFAPRAATAESRIAALICDPAQYDFGAAIRARLGDADWARLQAGDPTLEAELEPRLMGDPGARNGMQWRMTAHGVSTLSEMFRELSRFTLVGLADRISCPTLALAGEGDFAGTGQLETFAAAPTAPVTTHSFTIAEGAGGHCEGLGQDRFDQTVYGWLACALSRPLPRCDHRVTAASTAPTS